MTMLERAAMAVGEVVGYRGDDIITKDSLAMDIARAVLMAVRGGDGVHDHEDGRANFAAMIDAILNEDSAK